MQVAKTIASFSVVVPCFNEEEALPHCLESIHQYFQKNGGDYEILVVDDGSTDTTLTIAEQLKANYPKLKVEHFPNNIGVGRAISTGFERASKDFVFVQCADAPFSIQDLDRVRSLLDQNCDILVVTRENRHANSLFRKLTSLGNYYLIRLLFQVPIEDFQFIQFYRTAQIQSFLPLTSNGSFGPPELLIRCWKKGLQFKSLKLPFHRRALGEAKYGHPKRLLQSVMEIFQFRYRSLLGFRAAP